LSLPLLTKPALMAGFVFPGATANAALQGLR